MANLVQTISSQGNAYLYTCQYNCRCYDTASVKNGLKGPMDPSKKEVYKFLEEFFQEITQVFPDKYVHLGGDEVDFSCWCESQ